MFAADSSSPVICNWCGKTGHVQRDCAQQEDERNCTHCGKKNHFVHDCFAKNKAPKGKGDKGKGKGKGGKGKYGNKRKPYQENHYQAEWDGTPVPATQLFIQMPSGACEQAKLRLRLLRSS
jgi:hypothetical protein